MRRAQGASPRSPQRTRRLHGQRGLAWVALGALALALCALPLRAAGSLQQGRLGGGSGRRGGGAASADHPLFSRIDLNLRPFELSGISLQMVEQSYCQGSRGSSMRIQVIRGSVYVVGESPSFQSRLLGLKRQLLALWLVGQLPEGLDVVLEQEDAPTVRPRSADCPQRGPLLAPAKQPGNASHAHVLLAPDHSFAGWPEAHTLSWGEMLPLLQRAAARHPWQRRSGLLFFRGAKTGGRNLTDPDLSDTYPRLLDLVNWTSLAERRRFVSLADHCRHKLLLHLGGNTFQLDSAAEFWTHMLRPGEHLKVVDEVDEMNRGHHLAEAAEELQADDTLARRLGEAGAALVARSLAPPMVQEYWRRLLQRYRRLQDFGASHPHPDAVPLEESVLVPQVRNVAQRTCGACAPTREQLLEQRRADLGLSEDDPLPELVLPLWGNPEGAGSAGGDVE